MKKSSNLQTLIKMLVKEAFDAPTIPASASADEAEFAAKYPKWGAPGANDYKLSSPARVKAKQIVAILKQRGHDKTTSGAKVITQNLLPFLEKMDPQTMFVATAADLADDFEREFFS